MSLKIEICLVLKNLSKLSEYSVIKNPPEPVTSKTLALSCLREPLVEEKLREILDSLNILDISLSFKILVPQP